MTEQPVVKVYRVQRWNDDTSEWEYSPWDECVYGTRKKAEQEVQSHTERALANKRAQAIRQSVYKHDMWRRDEALLAAGITKSDYRILVHQPEPVLLTEKNFDEHRPDLAVSEIEVGYRVVEDEVTW